MHCIKGINKLLGLKGINQEGDNFCGGRAGWGGVGEGEVKHYL